MKKTLVNLTAIALVLLLSSCATLFSNSNYPFKIDSTPDKAKFEIFNRDGNMVVNGTTPQMVRLKSNYSYFQAESYNVVFYGNDKEIIAQLPISFHVDGWYIAGNLLIFPIWPISYLIVDPLSGAMWTPDQRYIQANLSKGTASNEIPEIKVMTLEQFQGDKSDLIPVESCD